MIAWVTKEQKDRLPVGSIQHVEEALLVVHRHGAPVSRILPQSEGLTKMWPVTFKKATKKQIAAAKENGDVFI